MSPTVMPSFFRSFSVTSEGPVSMIEGSEPMAAMPCRPRLRGLQPQRLTQFLGAEEDARGAVDHARGIAGVVDVVHLLDLRVALDGDGVEAHLAIGGEGGVQGGQALHRGLGPHVLVMVEERQAELVLHRQDRFLETALAPGLGGALLAFHGEGVDVRAGEAVPGWRSGRRICPGARNRSRRPRTGRPARPRRPSSWAPGSWPRRRRRWPCRPRPPSPWRRPCCRPRAPRRRRG